MFGRLANFINGELYGRPTTVPWAMQFPSELLDPSFPADKVSAVVGKCEAIDPALARAIDPVREIIAAARTNPQVREILSQFLTPRHPSQLYEAFLEGLLLFVCLITIRLRFRQPNGITTGFFFLLYPTMRIIGEFFREPDAPLTGPFTRGQFLSLFMFLVGVAFLINALRQRKGTPAG
jgi:phosphatidylglycerol:prolipoprotein diacylglycerol transferase